MALQIEFQSAPIYSLAFQQNQYPLITLLALKLDAEDAPLRDIKVTLSSDPEFFEPVDWYLDYLAPPFPLPLTIEIIKYTIITRITIPINPTP